jgi:hypothetical protein
MTLNPDYIPKFNPTGDIGPDRLMFLDETVAFYGADPKGRRAIAPDSGNCCYRTEAGNGCAIGRHILPDHYDILMDDRWKDGCKYIVDVPTLIEDFPEALPEAVIKLGGDFLSDVQSLHDAERNWDFKHGGLSNDGQIAYEEIVDGYINSTPSNA